MPIQMFNWVSRPDPAFSQRRRRCLVLLVMTLAMNGFAIWFRIHAPESPVVGVRTMPPLDDRTKQLRQEGPMSGPAAAAPPRSRAGTSIFYGAKQALFDEYTHQDQQRHGPDRARPAAASRRSCAA
jgi:hypothetical protein